MIWTARHLKGWMTCISAYHQHRNETHTVTFVYTRGPTSGFITCTRICTLHWSGFRLRYCPSRCCYFPNSVIKGFWLWTTLFLNWWAFQFSVSQPGVFFIASLVSGEFRSWITANPLAHLGIASYKSYCSKDWQPMSSKPVMFVSMRK